MARDDRLTLGEDKPDASPWDDIWPRWGYIWSGVFYGSLLISIALAWSQLAGFERAWAAGLVAAAAGLHTLVALYLPRRLADIRRHPTLLAAYIVLLAGLWLLLLSIHPAFYFLLGGLVSQTFFWLPVRWAGPFWFVFLIGVAVWQANPQDPGALLQDAMFWVWVFVGLSGVLLAMFVNAVFAQSARRQALIEELREARAELATTERRAGVLDERHRLAQEIHDTLAQGFTSITLHLEAADQAIGADDAVVRRHVDRARQTARASLEQARRVVQDLRPTPLEQASLPEALTRTAQQWAEHSDVEAHLAITGVPAPLHPDVEVTLWRAAQEALHNVRKHAGAREVTVTLSYMPDLVVLDVQDNGQGMSDAAQESTGFGLASMRQGVEQLGGTLAVESTPGEGTTLVVQIPLGATK